MNRLEALEVIKSAWDNPGLPLDERALSISACFYSTGLDLDTVAAYINATTSELESLLNLGGLDEELLGEIAELNPPRTAWTFLGGATESEIRRSLPALSARRSGESGGALSDIGRLVYQSMIEVAELSPEQKVACLSAADLNHALKKAVQYKADNKFMGKFLTSIASQRARGKTLTSKQSSKLFELLGQIADAGAIARGSIDGDQEVCDRILDALGR